MRTVIFGLGKTGTTALYYAVAPALPSDTRLLFEPAAFRAPGPSWILAKVLIRPEPPVVYSCFDHFDKRVLLVRDPRDQLISRLLYGIYDVEPQLHPAIVAQWREMVRYKQANPGAIAVVSMCDFLDRLGANLLPPAWKAWDAFDRFHDTHSDCFLCRYEDYVDGKVSELAAYLGTPVVQCVDVHASVRRVERTRKSGDWVNWFTADDVSCFRPWLTDFLRRYAYSDDWTTAEKPIIHPEHSFLYVDRLVQEQRQMRSGK